MSTRQADNEKQDRALRDSFPASDPPASSGITGPRATPPQGTAEGEGTGEDDSLKGRPTERHKSDTAYHSEKSER